MAEEHHPTILIDSREEARLRIDKRFPVEIVGLPVGDYGIRGFSDWNNPAFIVERKSLDDLCGSLGKGRARFLREIEKMRQFRFRALVIEAARDTVALGTYQSLVSPASLLSTLDALSVRAGLHVYWCGDAEGAARQVESLVRQFVRGIEKDSARLEMAAEIEGD